MGLYGRCSERTIHGLSQWEKRGPRYRASAALDLAPTFTNFSLTISIRRQRRRKRTMTAVARRIAAAAEKRGGRRRGEVVTGQF